MRPDVMTAWLEDSHLVDSLAPLNWHAAHDGFDGRKPLVVATEPRLFSTLGVKTRLGSVPLRTKGLVITDNAWHTLLDATRISSARPCRSKNRSCPS